MYKKYLFAFLFIIFTYSFLFSKDAEKTNSFAGYIKGRNSFGINLSPSIYGLGIDLIGYEMFSTPVLDKYVRPILLNTLKNGIDSMVRSQINTVTSVLTENQITGVVNDVYNIAKNSAINVSRKTYGFAIGFSYDFMPTSYMTVPFDLGFTVGGMMFYNVSFSKADLTPLIAILDPDVASEINLANINLPSINISEYHANYFMLPWSFGVKFFPKNKAPYGFFLYPKIGGTYINISGSIIDALGYNGGINETDLYMSCEIGWNIQLFPKRGANWKVKPSFNISILDIGFYLVPWATPFAKDIKPVFVRGILEELRFIPLPRLGISISF